VFHVSSSKHHVDLCSGAKGESRQSWDEAERGRPVNVRLSAIVGENVVLPSLFDMRS